MEEEVLAQIYTILKPLAALETLKHWLLPQSLNRCQTIADGFWDWAGFAVEWITLGSRHEKGKTVCLICVEWVTVTLALGVGDISAPAERVSIILSV